MDALREWMESDLDVIMVGTWMLCGNGWSLIWTLSWLAHGCSAGMHGVGSGRYHGWHTDALREWMESDLDVIMVGTWMLCGNGRYHGEHMDALREWMESDLDVIMVGTMLCGNAWSLIWTLSWSAHGCSAKVKETQATNNPKNAVTATNKRRNPASFGPDKSKIATQAKSAKKQE